MYKEDVITAEECMNYLPLYTTVSLNVFKKIFTCYLNSNKWSPNKRGHQSLLVNTLSYPELDYDLLGPYL